MEKVNSGGRARLGREGTALGYRVTEEGEVDLFPVDLLQISVYRGWTGSVETMSRLAALCRTRRIPYLIHPLEYFLSDVNPDFRPEMLGTLRRMAREADPRMGLVLHDEFTPWGTRLEGIYEEAYEEALAELTAICPVSIENGTNTRDIKWFWEKFAPSLTLDIGHVETAGIDSEMFVEQLEPELVEKVDFVHLHRHNGVHYGSLRDHWSLLEDCRELRALKRLLQRKRNLAVILEIADMENLEKSLSLLERTITAPNP